MNIPPHCLAIVPLFCLVAHAQEAPPIEAQKYHDALLKHPNNPTVFSRFYDAWIDAKSIESLEDFLKSRAETHGGIDYVILARYQLRRGQDPNALASLNKAIESLPEDAALLMERANLLVRSLDFVKARKDLEAVIKHGNEALSIEASKLIGKSYLREGNPDAAIEAWQKILTTHPNNEDLLEDLVELASAAEQSEQSLKYSEQLIAATADPYKKALRLIRRGELLTKSGESDKAIALWSETLSQTGEGSWLEREILAYIEQSYRRLDRIDLLSTKYEELATAFPRRLLIHRELAKLEAASGDIDSAIGRFREVLRRSPGEPELREEFIRLLINSERFDDASVELGKMIKISPENPELHLRMAELAFEKAQVNPDIDKQVTSTEILTSLEKARKFLDPNEATGLRIANLMIRYELGEDGENLLKQLSTKPDATTAPAEALAAEYTRTKRPSKALEILTDLSKSPNPETVLRATNAMAPLTKSEVPFNILLSRLPDFPNNNPYIAALIQASLAAKKPAETIPSALKLVRSSKLTSEIQDATKLANAVIIAAEKGPDTITELSSIEERSIPETCLLASLLEIQSEHEKADALFENAIEPTLLRFHSSLLSVRGDFKAAIASLNRLAETSGDNSASYFKELSDLQLRSGDSEACLKTIEQWKITAPSDKTPWTIAARLLRESGKYPEAIETTRRALSRFNNDEDLSASLADLYQQTGDRIEAESIYWKLYDQAPDPSSQSRWAARLSALAQQNGRTEELKEKFIQRSRSNNQSIGPILSLVELARVTNNNNALLEYLYQALRLKPKDIDIRLQVASSEKQAGNLEKQISVLNEGIDHDKGGRIRTSLAQSYIDQGHVIKGMHMLRALSGERASDPRLIETAASSIANTGMIAEAIQYLEESLPTDADWRARFLLATLLQNDGRESEAADIYLTLLDAKTEIQGLIQSSNNQSFLWGRHSMPIMPQQDMPNDFRSMMSSITQEIYQLQNSRQYRGNQRPLPTSPVEVKFRSMMQLAFISSLGNKELTKKIHASKIDDLHFITDVISNFSNGYIDFIALLEKYPNRIELVQYYIQNGIRIDPFSQQNPIKIETLQKLLKTPELDEQSRIQLTFTIIQLEPKNEESWNSFIELTDKHLNTDSNPQINQIYYQIFQLLTQHKENIPSKHLPKLKETLLAYASSEQIPEQQRQQFQLNTYALFGDLEPWIAIINSSITTHRVTLKEQLESQRNNWIANAKSGYYQQFNISLPQSYNLPITSIPAGYLQSITPDTAVRNRRAYYQNDSRFSAKDLIKHIDEFESPLLRAWIALQSGDEKAIKKALSDKIPEVEADDFIIIKIWNDIQEKRYPEAARALQNLYQSSKSNPWVEYWAQTSFISVSASISKDERKEFDEPVRKILTVHTKVTNQPKDWNYYGRQASLAEIAKSFEFDDLQKIFIANSSPGSQTAQPRPINRNPPSGPLIRKPALIASPRVKPQQRPLSPIDRFEKFSLEGKNAAAAHELVSWYRKEKQRGSDITYQINRLKINEEVKKEILTLVDPGANSSLTKRLEYIDICEILKESDTALTSLRALAAERPFDLNIKIALAFAIPTDEVDAAANLLKDAADSPLLYATINKTYQRVNQTREEARVFGFFELYAKFLEVSDSIQVDRNAGNEMSNQIYYFASGSSVQNTSSLFGAQSSNTKETPTIKKQREISRRLAFAMLKHSQFAESGFRFIRAAKWIEDPSELDDLARKAILLHTQKSNDQNQYNSQLPEYSAAGWLCDRIKASKSANEIIPDEFLASLEKNDPRLPTLLKALSSLKSIKDIRSLWDTEAMLTNGTINTHSIIQKAVMDEISTIPGSTDFFISIIEKITPEELYNVNSRHRGQSPHLPTIRAALEASKGKDEKGIRKICSAIVQVAYGKDLNPKAIAENHTASSTIRSIFNDFSADPVTLARIIRTFDSLKIPIDQNYQLRNSVQKSQIKDAKEALKLLDDLGFLNDTSNWRPLASYSVTNESINNRSSSKYILVRNSLMEEFIGAFDYTIRTKELPILLEKHQPQTFGSLITASIFSSGSERERLGLKAFKHAAKHLAKASPEKLDDISLAVQYLPYEAVTILPAQLQAIIKEKHDKQIAEIVKTIDDQFTHISQYPNQNPFNNVQSQIIQLAKYDLDKSIEIFQRVDAIYLSNIAYFNAEQRNFHEDSLQYIIQSLSGNSDGSPENGLRFYHAIRNSPQSSRYGIGSKGSSSTYLIGIGNSIGNHNRAPSAQEPNWLQPWIVASSFSEELQNDALAATACYSIGNRSTHSLDEAAKLLKAHERLSDKARELALTCLSINYWARGRTPEDKEKSEQAFVKLMNDPIFDSITKTQIAFTAIYANRDFLTSAKITEAFADIFKSYCSREYSAVNNMSLYVMGYIPNLTDIVASKASLRKISEAFWDNANSTTAGDHMQISEQYAKSLFLTAIRVEDFKNSEALLPHVRTSLIGNLDTIASLIISKKFELAASLIPDQSNPYTYDQRVFMTPELDQKIDTFLTFLKDSDQSLRFQCKLLTLIESNRNGRNQDQIEAYRKKMIEIYQTNPPKSQDTKIEVLSILITGMNPIDPVMKKDICEIAANLNPKDTISNWSDKYRSNNREGLSEEYPFKILCTAAMIHNANGDPSLFIATCESLTSLIKQTAKNDVYQLHPIIEYFCQLIVQTTAEAVAADHTKSFPKLIKPLKGLIIEISKNENLSTSFISQTFAAYDFISYWVSQPENSTELLKQLPPERYTSLNREFAFPRLQFNFLNTYENICSRKKIPRYGDDPIKLVTSILSRASLADIYVTQYSWVSNMANRDLEKEIKELVKSPPETLSLPGKLLLQYHDNVNYLAYAEKIESYRSFLKQVPNTIHWDNITVNSKLHLIYAMGRLDGFSTADKREVFDSIDSNKVPEGNKSFYQRTLNDIKKAEAKPE